MSALALPLPEASTAPAESPVVSAEALVRRYGEGALAVEALRGVSLDVDAGRMTAIMGPSGSGKSTLMNIIGCLDRLTEGQYVLDGIDVSQMPDNELAEVRNRKIGFVFQTFNLLPRTSALENVELPLLYSRVPAVEGRARAEAKLVAVGLAERADHHPSQLSGGQQQRVAIARALINDPVLILADEPTGNLDTRTSIEVMALLQDLNRQGITVVLVTHEADISQFASRVMVFRDGRVTKDEAVAMPREARRLLATLPPEEDDA